jgi:hypothetical protein
MATKKAKAEQEVSVEDKLKSLFKLQSYLSEIDRIKTLRGELPLEVADLDDEIAGLGTRINNFQLEVKQLEETTYFNCILIDISGYVFAGCHLF